MGKLALRVTELVNYVDLDGNVAYEYRTPAWQPIYKRLERFTPSCMQVMQSLDEFIEHNKERLMAEKPKTARTITLLEHWTPSEWPESYKQAWLGWWRDTGQALAQPGDLARLATLWTIVSLLDRGNLPETFDQSRLKELAFYNLNDIFPAPKASSRPVPDDEVTRFLRARMNPRVLWQVQYFLFAITRQCPPRRPLCADTREARPIYHRCAWPRDPHVALPVCTLVYVWIQSPASLIGRDRSAVGSRARADDAKATQDDLAFRQQGTEVR